jgi:glutathione S-transferase
MALLSITLHGAPYSVYTRIVRLVLVEKGLAYDLNEVDIFGRDRDSDVHRARHPFNRIPALTIDDVTLYETSAIARYLDDAFPAPPLQPSKPLARARMNTMISLMDNYAFRGIVWGVVVERVRKPAQGGVSDEALIAAGLDTAKTLLSEMTKVLTSGPWLAGDQLTLADVWAAPMFILFDLAAEGRAALDAAPPVRRWLDAFKARPSAIATRFPIEVG